LVALYAPLAWVRKLQYFRFGYIFGNVMIIFTVLVISSYCISYLAKDGPKTDEFRALNRKKMWDMIGFSFYCFEGIGVVLPIMEQTKDK
jgi:amino acid permease